MSVEKALEFISQVRASKALQSRVHALRGANALADLVRIAAEEGFTFTEADYREAVVQSSGGELTDEALDQLNSEMRQF